MHRHVVSTPNAPAAVGPYSQAIRARGEFLFVSGQGAITLDGQIVLGDISAQTKATMDYIGAILEAAGLGFENLVKVNVLLASMDDFAAMNAVYGSYFEKEPPARAACGVGALFKGLLVEIEAIAVF